MSKATCGYRQPATLTKKARDDLVIGLYCCTYFNSFLSKEDVMRAVLLATAIALSSTVASAQQPPPQSQAVTVSSLTAEGFRIAGVESMPPIASIMTLQKDAIVFRCVVPVGNPNAPGVMASMNNIGLQFGCRKLN
jgi:hypothetical protein